MPSDDVQLHMVFLVNSACFEIDRLRNWFPLRFAAAGLAACIEGD
jgi:hypothetical protein